MSDENRPLVWDIEIVDDLPNPKRGPLAGVTLIRVVHRGVRAALDMARRNPEAAAGELARYVDHLDMSLLGSDPDGWYRRGAVQGAKDAWLGSAFRPPPDCPRGEASFAYIVGYQTSSFVVNQTRMEVLRG